MAIQQILYYLYILRKHGLRDVKGILSVPKEHLTEEVFLDDQEEAKIEENLQSIRALVVSEILPKTIDKPACKSCAYYEFCYI